MINKELQEILKQYPDDVKVLVNGIEFGRCNSYESSLIDIEKDDIELWGKNELVITGTRG